MELVARELMGLCECYSNTKKISEILDILVDNSTYDKRLRPKHGAEPVNIGITIHVTSISAISEINMDFTIDFYLRQTWNDPRLAFRHHLYGAFENNIDSLTVSFLFKIFFIILII
ncbi:unnamed protein product [Onchocerca flexuosa]|uniref:Neur_chan_LBD domain-containing protein n=1 Tax=Onchocerca flexuosa TaxID=387005 RepID=A0A183HRI2_9BILA|nr:unnamed protein product [Onchocerca flexuosa]